MSSRYSEILIDHARHPHNFGADAGSNARGTADFGGKPPKVEFFLRIHNGFVESASFEAAGCGVSVACGSILTELVTGRSLEECLQIGPQELAQTLEGIPNYKMYCPHVAIRAMRAALSQAGDW